MYAAGQAVADAHPENGMLRCLIVDDSGPFLRSARDLLQREGVEVLGTASNSADALERTEKLCPELVLVDVVLGTEWGFDLAERLSAGSDPPAVIMISSHSEEDFEELIAASPAVGFLGKASLSSSTIKAMMHNDHEPMAVPVVGRESC